MGAEINEISKIKRTNRIKSIAIDAGHGGRDPGATAEARSANETGGKLILEKDLNLRLGAELFGQALEAGFEAYLLRGGDYDLALTSRAELANQYGVDLFLSVHHNGAASSQASGTETLYYPGSKTGQALAGLVQKAMVARLGLTDRGIKSQDNLHLLKATKMAAILIEPLFLTGARDQTLLETDDYFKNLARAVIAGLIGL